MIHVVVLLGRPEHQVNIVATVAELLSRKMRVEVMLGGEPAPAALIDLQVPVHSEHTFLEPFIAGPGRKVFLDPIGPVPDNQYGAPVARLMIKFGIPVMLFEAPAGATPPEMARHTADRIEQFAVRTRVPGERPATAPDGRLLAPDMGYERYVRLMGLADEINRGGDGPFTVLDIGGEDAALRQFIPRAAYTAYSEFITRETPAPHADGAFDVVVAADVLEHVSPHDRGAFLGELVRVAKRRVVFSFPQSAADPHEKFLLTLLPDHRWLREHQENGLPDPAAVEAVLNELGATYTATPNHNLTSWVYAVFFDHQQLDPDTREDFNLFQQLENYPREKQGACYRVIYTVDK